MLSIDMINNISITSPSYVGPVYFILDTVEDTITGKTWHKLLTNEKATRLILKSKRCSGWDIQAEITGRNFIWATTQFLTLLHIQGLQQAHD
jgi:hypothetical protein